MMELQESKGPKGHHSPGMVGEHNTSGTSVSTDVDLKMVRQKTEGSTRHHFLYGWRASCISHVSTEVDLNTERQQMERIYRTSFFMYEWRASYVWHLSPQMWI
ncbi:hypothetical protein C0J52_21103 [Blattella germanica]|nr:hypothetical protein C0J52_21103 [Blattella germanica]